MDGKEWRCLTCGEVLGRVFENGNHFSVLQVGAVRIDGHAVATCPKCGKKRSWIPSEEAMQNMLDHWRRSFGGNGD